MSSIFQDGRVQKNLWECYHLGYIWPKNILTSICGNGCVVNLKGSCLSEETYGLKCFFSHSALHASAGTIRRLCTSKTKYQDDAKFL